MKRYLLIPVFLLSVYLFAQDIGGDYYVATDGNDNYPGTYDQPWATWQKAFNEAEPGDTVYFRGGIWQPTESQPSPWQSAITKIAPNASPPVGNNGTYENPICFFNYPGETPILDGINITTNTNFNSGISMHRANFIHFRGLTIKNVKQKKDYVECFGIGAMDCSNLVFENISVHNIDGNAFRYGGAMGYHGIEFDTTRYINCDAFNNCDSLPRTMGDAAIGGAADGFKTWNEPGAVFIFDGCRAWNNSDDGIDPGTDPITIIRNCWSFENGYLDGDGVGIKTGGMLHDNGNTITRVIENSITAANSAAGFFLLEYEGYYRTNARFYNNLAYANETGFNFSLNTDHPEVLAVYNNNISYENTLRNFSNAYQVYSESHNSWDLVDGFPGYINTDSVTITDNDFISVDVAELKAPRNPDGSLPDIDFFKLNPDSDLIDAGSDVGLPFKGVAPDMGPFEYGTLSINITSPIEGESFSIGDEIPFKAISEDPYNTISNVSFYIKNNTEKIGDAVLINGQWKLNWICDTIGFIDIRAVATNNVGESATSSLIYLPIYPKESEQANKCEIRYHSDNNLYRLILDEPLPETTEFRIIYSDGKMKGIETIEKDLFYKDFNFSYLLPGLYFIQFVVESDNLICADSLRFIKY